MTTRMLAAPDFVAAVGEAGFARCSALDAGQKAYEAFAKALAAVAAPEPWDKLPRTVRRAWDAAGLAAVMTLKITVPGGESSGRRPPRRAL